MPIKQGSFNYDAKIEGVKALDKYTIQFKLTQPDYNFPYILAYSTFERLLEKWLNIIKIS